MRSNRRAVFLSDERVRIIFSDAPVEHRNYEEMGFGDGRGGKPRAAWQALREFSGDPTKPLRIDKKRAQEIRALLQKQFLTKSDPLVFKKRLGYLTRFKICRSIIRYINAAIGTSAATPVNFHREAQEFYWP
jgi:hypothetical protein